MPVQVDALERQMLGVGTLRSLVREVQASVDKLAAAQGTLRADVESHCSHSSALLTQLQVRRRRRATLQRAWAARPWACMHARCRAADLSGRVVAACRLR